jgi:hypothetical protein
VLPQFVIFGLGTAIETIVDHVAGNSNYVVPDAAGAEHMLPERVAIGKQPVR